MKSKFATGTLAIVAGMAIGWFAAPTEKPTAITDKPSSTPVLEKLVEAGRIVDQEQLVLAVRAAFADCKAAELEDLADSVMKLAARRPDMNLREEFLRRWGGLAPQKALAFLGSASLPHERATVLTAWGKADPDGVAKSFRPVEKELTDDFQAVARALLAGIAEADPIKAIRFADRFALADLTRLEFKIVPYLGHPTYAPSGSYQKAIDNWIRHDPSGAFEVMISLGSTNVREQALNELFSVWPYREAVASHAAALRLLERTQLEGDSRVPLQSITLVETLARKVGKFDGLKAYERVLGLSDPHQRLAAVKATLEGWTDYGKEHLPAVADFVAMRLNSDAKASSEHEMMVHAAEWTARWLTEDGENDEGMVKAAAWMEKLPAGDARDAAMRGIGSAFSWLPEQLTKFETWANALPPSRQKDVAVATCVARISEKEPARAMDLAATIEDPTLRAGALARVGSRFIPKEEIGTKAFDVRKWMLENPEIAEELRAARGGD